MNGAETNKSGLFHGTIGDGLPESETVMGSASFSPYQKEPDNMAGKSAKDRNMKLLRYQKIEYCYDAEKPVGERTILKVDGVMIQCTGFLLQQEGALHPKLLLSSGFPVNVGTINLETDSRKIAKAFTDGYNAGIEACGHGAGKED